MRTIVAYLLLIVFASCNNSKEEKEPSKEVESSHSGNFNSSVQSAMSSYTALTEAFVNWDSSAVDQHSQQLKVKLDSINFYGFTPETITAYVDTLAMARKDLEAMTAGKDIASKRHHLNDLTVHLYSFLEQAKYDENKIYLNECPMAFNDTEPGVWLSETDSIRNPYLGLHHPKYGKAMIECGSTKSTIDFTSKK
jgi:hypothetical protein